MNKQNNGIFPAMFLMLGLMVGSGAQASLYDRGGGLIYDDVLNVTWLQDANYARTSGYGGADGTGKMDWATAMTWAANLVYDGYDDWRLATNTPINGSRFIYTSSNSGTADVGYNITSPRSELAYMYSVNLGLTGYYSTTGVIQSNFGIFGNGTTNGVNNNSYDGQNNVGLVKNLQSFTYWSGADYSTGSSYAWVFAFGDGGQGSTYKGYNFYAWAVRPGDVAAVPLPAAIWLFACGLGLLTFTGRAKQKDQ
ncbi:hypothetical protein RO575_12475 [Methylomonas sp. MO1]|uniref:Lcl domain-containing protein n=1 Tax=Methylomonas sp. MO1 TaxID=3073619 RepID=UPI0028A4A9F5|nr:hypothetical protein [Methylomonas sp. MO1]MDT4290378.1 hypothetical protein [Methylomonas sp. MO1]